MRFLIIIVFLNLTIICLGQSHSNIEESVYNFHKTIYSKGDTMDQIEFWRIIEYSKTHSNHSYDKQVELLLNVLFEYAPDQIIEFEKILRHFVIEADDFKVMAAEKIIEGWVSDDSYLYFRCWLISQGQETFEETLKSPEYLADIVYKGINTQFEDLLYVTTRAFIQKTGKTNEDETFPRSVAYKNGLDYDYGAPPTKGTDWVTEQLPTLYPKLWAKFNL